MTRWIILASIVVALSVASAAYAYSTAGSSSRSAEHYSVVQHRWVIEFRRRWKAERKTSHRQAVVIRALRSKTRDLKTSVHSLQSAMKTSPYGSNYLETAFLCIHGHEGSWTDPSSPFWGGLQMDMGFQKTYGPEYLQVFGTADHWPQSVQIAVAIKAYISGRGFGPWPNTRRKCGL